MLVTGPNGVGKTNLLEAAHVGAQGFSPRSRAEAQLVRFGEAAARVELAGHEAGTPVRTRVTVSRGEAKKVELNGATLAAADELRTRLSALFFNPDRLAVVKGGPIVRRSYFDRMLGRLEPAQAALPGEYGRALAQRNASLRRLRAGLGPASASEPWSDTLASLGTELDNARAALVGLLSPPFASFGELLGLDAVRLRYEAHGLTRAELDARFASDLERGATGAGPHLRDVGVLAGERDLRTYGSQGEQRAAVLALVLAEAAVTEERQGSPPLLLLDDVLSELDAARRAALVDALPPGGQTLITTTSRSALPEAALPSLEISVSPGEARAA